MRDLYPFYHTDFLIEVSDEIAQSLKCFDLYEQAYRLRRYRHKAYYSLDQDSGIEHDILFISISPYEIFERKTTRQEIHSAIAALPDKQAKRIYAHYFLEMSNRAIAVAEGVDESAVRRSIQRGLRSMERFLKELKFLF
ncbi:MAG TPA: sigma factor-like helix-turn-helix DNA-binding protein [Prolixibacteraceae bacterium]